MVLSGCAFRSQVAHSSSLLNVLKFSECYLHKCCKLSIRCFTFLDNFCKFGPKLQSFDILSFFRIYTLKAKRAAYVYRKGCPPFLHKRDTQVHNMINRILGEDLFNSHLIASPPNGPCDPGRQEEAQPHVSFKHIREFAPMQGGYELEPYIVYNKREKEQQR